MRPTICNGTAETVTRAAVTLALLLTLALSSLTSLGSQIATASVAQPLCLGDTIWDEAQQQCVPIAEESASPSPVESPSPSLVESPSESPVGSPSPPAVESPIPDLPASGPPGETTATIESAGSAEPPTGTAFGAYDPSLSAFYGTINSCPDDRDWYAVADADAFHDPFTEGTFCPDAPSTQVSFIIEVNGQRVATPSATPVSISPSYAYVQNLPPGDYTIDAANPAGYGMPIVYCRLIEKTPEGRIVRVSQRYFATIDGVIEIPAVLGGEGIQCGWNNVPTDASARIEVQAFQCPAGFDLSGLTPSVLRTVCPQAKDRREFVILGPGGVDHQYADSLGSISYEYLLPGTYLITGFQPAGAPLPSVFCGALGLDGETVRPYGQQFPVGTDSISYQINTLETLICHWFYGSAQASIAVDLPTGRCAGTIPTAEASRTGRGITIGRDIVCRQEGAQDG